MACGLSMAFLASISIVALTDAPWWRANGYSHSKSCLYALSRAAPDREVVVLGSSRMRQAIDPSTLARLLAIPEQAVVNLSRPERDAALDADQLEWILRTGRPRIALVELHVGSTGAEAIERRLDPVEGERPQVFGGVRYSQGVLLLRPLSSLFADSHGLNPIARLHAGASIVAWRLEETFRILATRTWFNPGSPSIETDPGRTNICAMSPELAAQIERPTEQSDAQAKAFAAAFAGRSEDVSDFLTASSREVDRRAVRRMAELARRHDVRLVFVYVPSRRMPVPKPDFAEVFERHMGAPLLIPPRALIDDLDRRWRYYDNAHLTASGGAEFTVWAGGALTETRR
jgi:hypothetical protein